MATYTQGTGQPGNGPAAGGAIDLTDTNVLGENFETFGCKVSATNLNTPDYMTDANSVYFERKVFDSTRKMADGVSIDFWGFEDLIRSKGLRLYPGPLMRLQEGQLAHVKLKSRKGMPIYPKTWSGSVHVRLAPPCGPRARHAPERDFRPRPQRWTDL